MKRLVKDKLEVGIFENRTEMGEAAAKEISAKIKELLAEKQEINIIFAAAPSQNEAAPQGFGNFLKAHIFGLVPFKSVNYIDITTSDPEEEAERYGKLLKANPTDIVVMGIGENGHIAFNDPEVADFNDKKAVKPVKLDEICRQQQVNDGCFKTIEEVPAYAMTLTVPTLVAAPWLFCIVPAATKAKAVYETINGRIDEHCPASILRTRDNAKLYLDEKSSAFL